MVARKLPTKSEIPISFLLLLSFTTLIATTSSQSTYVDGACGNSSGQALNSTYKTNLDSVLSRLYSDAAGTSKGYNWLSSDAGTSTGYNYTSNEQGINETVYGLYDCRGDVTGYFCQFCVTTAANDIVQRCPNSVTAVIFYDFCMLHYSNLNFFGKVSITPARIASGDKNISDPMEPRESQNFMKSLINKATNETNNLYAMGEFDLNHSEKRYGLVQCSRDITNEGCRQCLEAMLDNVSQCCADKQGWRALCPNCYMKYDTFKFYSFNNQSTSPDSAKQGGTNSRSRTLIISIIIALAGVALLGFCMYYIWRRNASSNRRNASSNDVQLLETTPISSYGHVQSEDSLNTDLPIIPLIIVQQSTNHFSESSKLGEGGFGPVYKGVLPNGREIAVKRLSKTSGQGLEELKNEVAFIAKLQHKNLVRLLGCCIEEDEKLLVYEYMPNFSLDFHLFNETKREQLDWKLRLNIINGIARGLLYLHEDSRLKVIHRDLKASNILLDQDMNPKISDFGLARTFERGQNQANTKRVVGTYGYMAPEYAMEGLFSVKSDVFSFGVLLLEIICGKRNSGFYLSNHGQSLLLYTWKLWCEGRCLELMDPILEKSHVAREVEKCIQIGLLCVQEDAIKRPTMSTVVVMLASNTMTLPKPNQPAFSIGRMVMGASSTSKSSVNEVTVSNIIPR